MIRSLLVLALMPSTAMAAEWWVGAPAEADALAEALDALWPEPHAVHVGAWPDRVELVWVDGHVNRFEGGRLVERAPAASPRTAVALARSWFAEASVGPQWVPMLDRPAVEARERDLAEFELRTEVDVREVTRTAAAPVARRERRPLQAWFGPMMELQSSVGSGLRAELRDPVGGELELVGWLQPAFVTRLTSSVDRGSWIALEARGAGLVDLVPGPVSWRIGPAVMGSDFGRRTLDGEADHLVTGGVWAGGASRLRVPAGRWWVGADADFRVPVHSWAVGYDDDPSERLYSFAGAGLVVGRTLPSGLLEVEAGWLGRYGDEATHGTPTALPTPLSARVSWMWHP